MRNSRGCVSGEVSYGALCQTLQQSGLASTIWRHCPHISVAGAVQTGTHGSGVKNSSLAGAVEGIDLVRPCGEQVSLSRADGEEFLGSVVGLGALGIVTGLRLAVRPSFSMRQRVLENLPWERALADFTQLVSSGYSVSLFTDYVGDSISQVWLSPFYRQQSVALHFTWKPLQPQVEAVLPHRGPASAVRGQAALGKLFMPRGHDWESLYPR